MIKSNIGTNKKELPYPKIMTSSQHSSKSYLAVVLFQEEGKGMVLRRHDASALEVGRFYDNLEMDYFKDLEDEIILSNVI